MNRSWTRARDNSKNKSQCRAIKGAETSRSILILFGRLQSNENKLDKDVANRKALCCQLEELQIFWRWR
jgi:hypothetical protein